MKWSRRVLSTECDGCSGRCDRELPCIACRMRSEMVTEDIIIGEAIGELRAAYRNRAAQRQGEGER